MERFIALFSQRTIEVYSELLNKPLPSKARITKPIQDKEILTEE